MSPTRDRGERRRRYHHGDLRRALLHAALALLEERGTAGLTVRAAARRVGVTHTAVYRHFPTKEALLAAVAEEGFGSLGRALRRSMAAAGRDPVARFLAIGVAYVRFASERTPSFRLMLGPEAPNKADYPALQAAARATFAILTEATAQCQAAHRMRAGDPTRLATAAWATMHGIASLVVDTRMMQLKYRDLDVKALSRLVLEDLHRGLREDSRTPGARRR
jgi:AcrR family transcriptional regulator